MVGTGAGVFTATESSAIAVVYTMFLAYVVFRDAKLRDFGKVLNFNVGWSNSRGIYIESNHAYAD